MQHWLSNGKVAGMFPPIERAGGQVALVLRLPSFGVLARSATNRAQSVLVLSAGLALGCGGRGADPPQQAALEPASSVMSSSPAPSESPLAADSSSRCSRDAADYIIAGSSEACSSRELPECPDGSRSFVDACGCGCSGAPAFPRACRLDCAQTGFCDATRFEDFPDLSDTLRAWQQDLQTVLEFSEGSWLMEGVCASDRRFLWRTNHYVSQAHIFNARGAFLGLGTQSDDLDETCGGGHYFPEPVRCADAILTRIWAEDSVNHLKVGDPITLPVAR